MKGYKKSITAIILVLNLIFLVGFILSNLQKESLMNYVNKFMDKNLTTDVKIEKLNFSVFRNFPNITIKLGNVVVLSGPGYLKENFSGINSDTLLKAKSVYIEFGLIKLLNKDFTIKNIEIKDGNLNVFVDKSGNYNFNILKTKVEEPGLSDTVKIRNISMFNINIYINSARNNLLLKGDIEKASLKGEFSGKLSKLEFKSKIYLYKLLINNKLLLYKIPVHTEFKFIITDNSVEFSNSTISLNKQQVYFKGIAGSNDIFDFYMSGKNFSIPEFFRLFPEPPDFLKKVVLTGNANFNGRAFNKNNRFYYKISFISKKASLQFNSSGEKLHFITIDGDFLNKYSANKEFLSLKIKDFSFTHKKNEYKGKVQLNDFDSPEFILALQGNTDISDINLIVPFDSAQSVSGHVSFNFETSGRLDNTDKITKYDFLKFSKKGEFNISETTVNLKKQYFIINTINGTIQIDNNTLNTPNLNFNFKGSDYSTEISAPDFFHSVITKNMLYLKATVNSPKILLEPFFTSTDISSNNKSNYFPENINFEVTFSINKIEYKKFYSSSVHGKLFYKPGKYYSPTFQFISCDGVISGNLNLSQSTDNIINLTSNTTLKSTNIYKLFYSFNNFNQQVIGYQNLKGDLSGVIDVDCSWDNNFHFLKKKLLLQSDLIIQSGELINYQPMLGLSKYINVEELKDIKFKVLQNQILIKNEEVIIPEMNINSSAFNISGSGIHRFNNSYEYHILVELKEILAKKARKNLKEKDEFGVIEDDGLGRINIPLKITGVSSNYDVHYDKKKAIENMKQKISDEKSVLKDLFSNQNNIENNGNENKESDFKIKWSEQEENKDTITKIEEGAEEPEFIIEWEDE